VPICRCGGKVHCSGWRALGSIAQQTSPDVEEIAVMRWIDQHYLATPFYGLRRMTAVLRAAGHLVNRKRVQRLTRVMGLEALGPKPKTSRPAPHHRIYPYLLRGLTIDRSNQVARRVVAADITDIAMVRGFLYLVVVMDWHSRYVLAWRLSNTMDTSFCVDALEDALRNGRPGIFNTDQRGSIHQRRLYRQAGSRGGVDQHGRPQGLVGQCLRRAPVAQPEIRRGAPSMPMLSRRAAASANGSAFIIRLL
jgi:transposase InsO family protein